MRGSLISRCFYNVKNAKLKTRDIGRGRTWRVDWVNFLVTRLKISSQLNSVKYGYEN